MLKELILKNRSYRRFVQDYRIDRDSILELIDLARLSPSGSNLQPLKYIISNAPVKNEIIFQNIKWAQHLKAWNGPEEGEKPSAYCIILLDTDVTSSIDCDHGIAALSILLGAVEKGLGGCIIGLIDRKKLSKELQLSDRFEIKLIIALGKPKEQVVIDPMPTDGNINYWRDGQNVHHVPKRRLTEMILDT
jgi:nitroreductase